MTSHPPWEVTENGDNKRKKSGFQLRMQRKNEAEIGTIMTSYFLPNVEVFNNTLQNK